MEALIKHSKANVFCEAEFLNILIEKLKKTDVLEGGSEYYKLFDLIFNRSKVSIDLSLEEINIKINENPYYKKLLKDCQLKSTTLEIEKISMFPSTLFFLNIPKTENYKYQAFGNLVINSDALKCDTYKFEFNPIESENFNNNNEFKNFDFLSKKYHHPINSIIIADDYLFPLKGVDYDLGFIDKFLKSVINAFFKSKLSRPISFTIITPEKNKGFPHEEIKRKINEIFQKKGNTCKIEILSGYNFHKRFILTNYAYILSDYGFNNFGKSKKNDFDFSYIFESTKKYKDFKTRLEEIKCNYSSSKNELLNALNF